MKNAIPHSRIRFDASMIFNSKKNKRQVMKTDRFLFAYVTQNSLLWLSLAWPFLVSQIIEIVARQHKICVILDFWGFLFYKEGTHYSEILNLGTTKQ